MTTEELRMDKPSGELEGEGRVDRLLREMLAAAIEARATDVHLEPLEDRSRVRFRVDGQLSVHRELERHLHGPLLLRLKILAHIPTDRSHLPQDGKWVYVDSARSYDIRISLIPFLHGEGAVLRILEAGVEFWDLKNLGFDGRTAANLEAVARGPDGLFLLTGPTGCGKSTTAHALLHGLNDGTRKIITVENPVEYAVDGIHSVEVSPIHGLGFADALRAVLRQSPDVLFIGEIRDGETAAIAIQAALTGHFVCSTLHCRDCAGAIGRLRQLQISPHLISAVLRGVLSQRLVRQLCPQCRVTQDLGPALRKRLALGPDAAIFHAPGCPNCRGNGYLGRTVLYEYLVPIPGKCGALRYAIEPTFETCAREKICGGITSVYEALAAID
jgi:general secretion pathway protein E